MKPSHRGVKPSVSTLLLVVVCGCGAESRSDFGGLDETRVSQGSSALTSTATATCDATVAAGDGWINRPVTSESGHFSAGWRSNPSGSSDGRPIDSVIGLSRTTAAAFGDLGPIVRFNRNGAIDARDGGTYVGGFPYTFSQGSYEFQLLVDVPDHRYSVWVRHLDAPFKPFELLAQDAAFRTEQQAVQTLANFATVIDSASGAVQHCGYTHQPASGCWTSGSRRWQTRSFTTLENQRVVLDFYALVTSAAVDAVVGASQGTPVGFGDLAAIVRFRPDGYLDARNGSAYGAEAAFSYAPRVYYHFNFEIDLAQSHYTVIVASRDRNPVVLARDYAFRSERAGVSSLDHLAQFVDSEAGEVSTCALVAH